MRGLTIKLSKRPALTLGLSLAIALAVITFKPGHALADCGINSGNGSDYAGAIIEPLWRQWGTGALFQANDVLVQIDTVVNAGPQGGNIIELNSGSRTYNAAFYQIGSGCGMPFGGDGINVVLGRGVTSPAWVWGPPWWGQWALDCDAEFFGVNNETGFNVYGLGVPAGARAGGWWEVAFIRPPNGFTTYAYTIYNEPAPPPATIQGRVFQDDNGNGVQDNGEGIIQYNVFCGFYPTVPLSVTADGIGASYPQYCNPQPYYSIGSIYYFNWISVHVNPPGGWVATTGTQWVLAQPGGVYDVWFGVRPVPSASTYCSGATSSASISWLMNPGPGIGPGGASGFYVDVSPNAFFIAGTYYNKWVGNVSSTTAPSGFNLYPAGAPPLTLSPGTTFYVRIYNGYGFSAVTQFTAQRCLAITNVNTYCAGAVSKAGISWDGNPSSGNQPPGQQGFYVEITQPNLGFGSGLYNLNAGNRYFATAADEFRGLYPSGAQMPDLVGGATYRVRVINFVDPNSPDYVFTATTCNAPYLRVYGGDVLAGADGLGSCGSANLSASISTYNNDNAAGAGYGGGGTQFAAQATGAISYFASSMLRSGAPPGQAPSGLSLSNTTAGAGGKYGGDFTSSPCLRDFYGTLAAYHSSAPTLPFPGGQDPDWPYNAPPYNYYQYNGNAIINAGTIQLGLHRTIYVNGDVLINGPFISFDGGARTSLADIPSFYLIVRGNIYIDRGVTNLDGVYIAQDDGSGNKGIIYTCASGFAPVSAGNLYSQCNNKLTINGAFLARQVKFYRSNGSIANPAATQTEGSGSANIAEVFNYTPELWLVNPGLTPISGNAPYQSITSLPPVL